MNKPVTLEADQNRLRTLGHVALFWISYEALIFGAPYLAAKVPRIWQPAVLGMIASVLMFVLTALLVRREGVRLKDVGAALERHSFARFLFGLLAGAALVALHVAAISLITEMHWVWAPGPTPMVVVVTLSGYVAMSCMEELAFRGFPLRRLEPAIGLWTTQATVAVAFALSHIAVGQPWRQALLGTGAGSILFGMTAIASRGLAMPIGLHAAWNSAEWALGAKGTPGLWKAVSESGHSSGIIGSVSYFCVMGIATLALWFWHQRGVKVHRN